MLPVAVSAGGCNGDEVLAGLDDVGFSVGVLARTTANGGGRGGVLFTCGAILKSEGGSSIDSAGERGDDGGETWRGRGVGVVSRGRGVFSRSSSSTLLIESAACLLGVFVVSYKKKFVNPSFQRIIRAFFLGLSSSIPL